MKRFKRGSISDGPQPLRNDVVHKVTESKMKMRCFFIACLILLSVVISALVLSRNLAFDVQPPKGIGSKSSVAQPVEVLKNKLLGGLLPSGFDENSCLSRYDFVNYRRELSHRPSLYLISKLRSYESLHKRCGPNTESYRRALEHLKSGQPTSPDPSNCNYLVWISFSGLGNRILTLASAFLYALLTGRVLLVDRGVDIPDLFCEPFPDSSWLLPLDFPIIDRFKSLDQNSSECYGNMLKHNMFGKSNGSWSSPFFVYLHLVHDYGFHDKLFFCDQDQSALQKVPWLIMKTDNYFIPSLFLIKSFEKELSNLFPEKETVFHFLGQYLLHPTNMVWGLITRHYQAYLAKADEKIGIQIRVFDVDPSPFKHVIDQILACTLTKNLLPQVNDEEGTINAARNPKTKAVLVTSLSSGYSNAIREKYLEHSTVTGEVISVYQPSSEGYQQTGKPMHNKKAWAEMYLLSLMDKLVTSSWSTFGYVAQGLGGLKPWILFKPENRTAPDPPCQRAMSMEPCFHAPPFYDCKKKVGIDTGAVVPHVRHCEDMSWGLKLVNPDHKL